MNDSSSSSASSDPLSSAADSNEDAGDEGASSTPPWEDRGEPSPDDAPLDRMSSSFALNAARLWVQKHQKTSMLGAFAVGVFVGALIRN